MLAAGAAAAPTLLFTESEVPALLDHILLGSNDLERGIEFVADHTGVRATFGGVHPGRGTQNALLSLGERRYMEIISLDPKQMTPDESPMLSRESSPLVGTLMSLTEPRLIGWAAHPGNLSAFAQKLRTDGVAFQGPTPGSRKRPDGRLLQWQTLGLVDDASGLLPFFIEWAPDSPHPSTDAPKGCTLARFAAETPDPIHLAATLKLLALNLLFEKGKQPRLLATIVGPTGTLQLSS